MKTKGVIKYFIVGFFLGYIFTYFDNSYITFLDSSLFLKGIFSGLFTSIIYLIFYKNLNKIDKNIKKWKSATKEEKDSYNSKFESKNDVKLKKYQYLGFASLLLGIVGVILIFVLPDSFSWIAGLLLLLFFAGSMISYSFVKNYFGNFDKK